MLYHQSAIQPQERQSGQQASQTCAQELEAYLAPFNERLDAYVNRLIVGNLTAAVAGIVQTRGDLTLSELGGTITSPEHAEARTQRLGRVPHYPA